MAVSRTLVEQLLIAIDRGDYGGDFPTLDGFTEAQVAEGMEYARQRGWVRVVTTVTGQRVIQGLTPLGHKVANTNTVLSKMIGS